MEYVGLINLVQKIQKDFNKMLKIIWENKTKLFIK